MTNAVAQTTPETIGETRWEETTVYPATLGLARLMRHAYAGGDLRPWFAELLARASRDARDAAAVLDMSTILQLVGKRDDGLALQAEALQLACVYRRPVDDPQALRLRVLALVVAGDFMANTPLDLLLDPADVELTLVYVDEEGRPPQVIPAHDVAVLAIGESHEARKALAGLAPRLSGWPRPLVNGRPERIAALTRDAVASAFATTPHILAPPVRRLDRTALAHAAVAADASYPLIVRPLGSHAGRGLRKLDDVAAVSQYLQAQTEDAFYVSPYVDYASDDGQFRKQRIVFVRGRPFICHMAVSSHWMVHYLSAGMQEDAVKRAEEAAFMRDFEEGFAQRHAAAFATLHSTVGLDYFGIDCAETRDGRLLLFEIDVAMIVHALDDPATFPYKQAAMRKMFSAFAELLTTLARAVSVPAAPIERSPQA